jgi:hypothetical protein
MLFGLWFKFLLQQLGLMLSVGLLEVRLRHDPNYLPFLLRPFPWRHHLQLLLLVELAEEEAGVLVGGLQGGLYLELGHLTVVLLAVVHEIVDYSFVEEQILHLKVPHDAVDIVACEKTVLRVVHRKLLELAGQRVDLGRQLLLSLLEPYLPLLQSVGLSFEFLVGVATNPAHHVLSQFFDIPDPLKHVCDVVDAPFLYLKVDGCLLKLYGPVVCALDELHELFRQDAETVVAATLEGVRLRVGACRVALLPVLLVDRLLR